MASLRNISVYSDSIPNRTAIFFNEDFPLKRIEPQTRACDRIGAIWARLKQITKIAEASPLMEKLGVCKTDRDAQRDLLPILRIIFAGNVEIKPSTEDSGIYFLSKNGEKFAVFKVGEKRARTELLARKIAHRAGLEKYAIPGIACTIQYPEFLQDEPVQVELFNGNVAVFSNSDNPEDEEEEDYNEAVSSQNDHVEDPYSVTGILEPYISEEHPVDSVEDFAGLITFALLIGLRDGKLDGMLNGQLIDLEDIMPARVIPEQGFNTNVAATHLPLLQHDLAKAPIPIATLQKLLLLISDSLPAVAEELAQETVDIADLAAESLAVKDQTPDELGHLGWTDGGCPIRVELPKKIMDKYPIIEVGSQDALLLTDEQIGAFSYRVLQLRAVLERCSKSGESLRSIDLVFAVDPFYQMHWNALQDFDRLPVAQVVGRFTPEESDRAQWSPEEVECLSKAKEEERRVLNLVRVRSCPPTVPHS